MRGDLGHGDKYIVEYLNFNSRPCVRGDIEEKKEYNKNREFQFTPLREGRLIEVQRASSLCSAFQFTPLREGRRGTARRRPPPATFQFTPLREGRRNQSVDMRMKFINFNSRPCVRGDFMLSKRRVPSS